MFLDLRCRSYIHQLLSSHLQMLFHLQMFGLALSLDYEEHYLFPFLSNLLCNLNRYVLCSRMYARLFLLWFQFQHLLDLLYRILECLLHSLLLYLQILGFLLLYHLQVFRHLRLLLALYNELCNLDYYVLYNTH